MGKIDDACREVVSKVEGSVACGVVDLDTGMLLGIFNNAQYTQTLNEVVAAATMDLFRGSNVGRVEQMVRAHRGVPENGEHYFQEINVSSEHNYHFAKTIKKGRAVIMLVTKKTTNIGMGWAMLKSVIGSVEPLVPLRASSQPNTVSSRIHRLDGHTSWPATASSTSRKEYQHEPRCRDLVRAEDRP